MGYRRYSNTPTAKEPTGKASCTILPARTIKQNTVNSTNASIAVQAGAGCKKSNSFLFELWERICLELTQHLHSKIISVLKVFFNSVRVCAFALLASLSALPTLIDRYKICFSDYKSCRSHLPNVFHSMMLAIFHAERSQRHISSYTTVLYHPKSVI